MYETGRFTHGEYHTLDTAIKQVMRRSAGDAVMLGYLLRRMMDERLWTGQYSSLDAYLREELHMDYTMACRFEAINRKYSVGGHSKDIDAKWEGYSQGVLIEMLNMPPELEGKVTPDMTVRQVREVKRQAREEKVKEQAAEDGRKESVSDALAEIREKGSMGNKAEPDGGKGGFPGKDEVPDAEYSEVEAADEVATSQHIGQGETEKAAMPQPGKSAYGLEKYEYPEGSLIATPGCGTHYCFICAQDCGIRQEFRYCRYAPLGNPFGCATMEFIEGLRADVRDRCQFVNNDLARHSAGTNEAEPCCMDCEEDCRYRCERSRKDRNTGYQETEGGETEAEQDGGVSDGLTEVRHILEKEQKMLDGFREAAEEDGSVLETQMYRRQAVIVSALTEMVHRMEDAEAGRGQEERNQPPLQPLKNNDQRREWLRAYKDWGLWYRDENIGVGYYKYEFQNGARLIAEVYQEEATKYHDAYETAYFHLVEGPDPPKGQQGICKWQWHGRYSRYPNSETELVEFLKEVQKKRSGDES